MFTTFFIYVRAFSFPQQKLNRYWFVLVEDKQQVALVYFKNENSYLARQRNEGLIRIDDFLSISVIGEHLGKPNAFSITTHICPCFREQVSFHCSHVLHNYQLRIKCGEAIR